MGDEPAPATPSVPSSTPALGGGGDDLEVRLRSISVRRRSGPGTGSSTSTNTSTSSGSKRRTPSHHHQQYHHHQQQQQQQQQLVAGLVSANSDGVDAHLLTAATASVHKTPLSASATVGSTASPMASSSPGTSAPGSMRESQFVRHLLSRIAHLEGKVAEQSATIETLNKQRTVQATELQRVLATSVHRHSSAVASLQGQKSAQTKQVESVHSVCSNLYREVIQLREHAVYAKGLIDALQQDAHACMEAEASLHAIAQQHAAYIQRMDEGLPNGLADMDTRQKQQLDILCKQLRDAATTKTSAQATMADDFDRALTHTSAALNIGLSVENMGSSVLKQLSSILSGGGSRNDHHADDDDDDADGDSDAAVDDDADGDSDDHAHGDRVQVDDSEEAEGVGGRAKTVEKDNRRTEQHCEGKQAGTEDQQEQEEA
ncbi:hypothetical protein PTSG_09809 [Salpingoeca rosetta]|uniref:Uncharacterized protein n=1 Tax=Salpingoeca rosetta (strain ATCC 50818 / BSB-021) TaxID=946362 RepID=F2UP42_SALR5|nr:uncharacterized protein PTSG_09809 [Salpingoeca rosetta]EGD79397.1 hypothetical protein PTSG_09809 [Salpingoeca rosetta]|eukprot:XP_004989166.1 hypothetical protein PTSG_09809 [Salpingoeca rosetta]